MIGSYLDKTQINTSIRRLNDQDVRKNKSVREKVHKVNRKDIKSARRFTRTVGLSKHVSKVINQNMKTKGAETKYKTSRGKKGKQAISEKRSARRVSRVKNVPQEIGEKIASYL